MRRDIRRGEKELRNKIIVYGVCGVVLIATIIFSIMMYSKKLSDDVKDSTISSEKIASIMNEEQSNESSESASSTIGKSIEEAEMQENSTGNVQSNITENINSSLNSVNTNTTTNSVKNETKNTNSSTENKKDEEKQTKTTNTSEGTKATEAKEQTTKKELSFEMPVDGEILKGFAKDNLVYSETLKEWVTHLGIDIKADNTTVVKAAEEGTIKTIKNDPRYGLTITIEHEDGFQTVYSNLLTSEFVVEGEKVKKGQSIGTVGNTAVFEIADESHLHFEILKDSVQVDPSIYLK